MQLRANGWLKRATREQKETLVCDLNVITRQTQSEVQHQQNDHRRDREPSG